MHRKLKNSEIVREILELEKRKKLFELKIQGVCIWKLLRFKVINELNQKLLGHNQAHTPIKKNFYLLLKNIILNNLKKLKKNNKIENLIFLHERFFLDKNGYKDIHTCNLWDINKKTELIYPLLTSSKYKNQNYNYSSLETFRFCLSKFLGKNFPKKKQLKTQEIFKLNQVEKELKDFFNLVSIESLKEENILKDLNNFIYSKKYFIDYLLRKSPKRIYLVCSYGKEALISAAQELGIEVIEIQHGVMNKYHLGYHFPNNKVTPYFPDKLIMFGDYWYNNTSVPLTRQQIEFNGYPYLEKQLNRYKGRITEQENTVLFISQGTIGRKFTEKAIEFAKDNPDKKIIIRLHPGEFSRWKTEYEILYENRNLLNIEISDNNDKNLYEYIFESEYIICVYSTVIYEALYLEKKVGVIDLPGIEYVEDLIVEKSLIKYSVDKEIDLSKIEKLDKTSKRFF